MESTSLWLPKYEQLMQELYSEAEAEEDGDYQELDGIERINPFLHDQLERYG